MKTDFYKIAFDNNIFAVTCAGWAQTTTTGGAIMASWIVVGDTKTLAIDSGIPEVDGFRTYLEEEFGHPVIMLNSHGHWDHVGCNAQFDQIWLNKKDWPLLLADLSGNILYTSPDHLPYTLTNICDKDIIDLGGRQLQALEIQGHTPGSIMLYEAATHSLFSGDSVARRILYGLMEWTPLTQYLNTLKHLSKLHINAIYSMHDPFPLPGSLPEQIIGHIMTHIETSTNIWELPDIQKNFLRILLGKNEADPDYFDFVMPLEKREETIAALHLGGPLMAPFFDQYEKNGTVIFHDPISGHF